jgi:Protein of unknown function (DUF1572)
MQVDVATHYFDEVGRQFRGYKRLADEAITQLGDNDLFVALDREANSIAIIVKHMAGNMRSRFTDFLTTDGEKPDRNRDQEFEIDSAASRTDLLRAWDEGWARVFATLAMLKPDDLMRTVTIRGESHTVLQALNRQLAHYAYHVGQIVFLAKHFRSNEWKSLSIPRGKSREFNEKPIADRKPGLRS